MLPIDAVLPELLDTLEQGNTALLQAPTGSGKTTRVPLALLEAVWRKDRRILLLEPRRLAARSAARFMAGRLGESAGDTVGYRTRLDTRVSAATRIEVVTEGILTRMIQSDPALSDYAAVIFDEFHERSLHADLGLALVRESQQALRDDLRLLVMSATLASERLSTLLGDCPAVVAEGRSFPVELSYRPPLRRQASMEAHAAAVVREALDNETGSILVFLPGMREIRRVAERLEDGLPENAQLHLLHGQLSPGEQDEAIRPAAPGARKIVLASAIAESSLTIEGIRVVIDAGWQRRARFDPNSGMTRLVTERVSKASAEQRRGRAGRLEPGHCYRLWSESEQDRLQPQASPEIVSADLAPLVLELAQWGVSDPAGMDWLDPPPAASWNQAVELLQALDALDEEARITAEGRAMLELGLHPRLAHMVLSGRRLGLARTAAELAALLSERDIGGFDEVDIALRLTRLRKAGRRARGMLARIRQAADRLAGKHRDEAAADYGIGTLLACAWPDRIGQAREGQRGRFLLSNGRGAFVDAADPLAGSEFLVACDLDGQAREARVYLAAGVTRDEIEAVLGDHVRTLESADWDERRGTVVARRERRLGALVLESTELQRPDPETLQLGLLAAVRTKGLAALPWTDSARQLQARVSLLRSLWPGDWPDLGDEALADTLEQWLAPWLAGMSRWQDIQALDLVAVLSSLIGHDRLRQLDELAPKRLTLPDGRQAKLDYRSDNPPSLRVKLQAMLGCRDTPTVARGRVPVQLHLLSPADRPLAVTADLASFWDNVYPDVRKDMRGRYPKHHWPEKP
ncbi:MULTISPECIES: ATP-dependent helicase HrpB [unclassified Wenzhouxiangella]|uniref:ATP-dependent helicase HrpB n=1 Tax=unclassified Wenzhouxiangella TaxID=2613841 RepID=UPI000E328D53|nr:MULTISPECIES: ATP-dependent helicase HrpB [unclassified Wenzhouxiangella]RFF27385.1 ATP-dependent helicase HrpB [Wenzhouxiangella sp. 15181]RFP68813.1 ATP-dependent helicase HrpB [Wenzhouxiangella sp. 15190]